MKARTEAAKVATKTIRAIRTCPKIEDLNPTTLRKQVSIKNKKKIIKHMQKHSLTPKQTAEASGASRAQIYAWRNDYNAGRFDLKHAVAVSRA